MAEFAVKAIVIAAMTLFSGSGHAKDVEALYGKTCAVCHAAGAAGAPRTGVAADWKPRMEKSMDSLVKSVKEGLNAMPPKGMCFECTDADYEALIKYMSTPR